MSAPLVVEDVSFSYGSLQVLFGISMHASAGESVALVGTNGAGKSTLLRVVAGLERPSAGRVFLDSADITGVPAEVLVRRGLVLVQGGRATFPDMSVRENLEIQGMTARSSYSIDLVFEIFPALRDCLRRPAGTLSGGQQQQLALAKAMLLRPTLLCIDELSLGLAPVTVESLIAAVRAIQALGVTVVLVEQSLNIAAALCDRAVFLEKGEVRFDGRVADLLERDDIARAVFFGAA
jgi:ABC-type branched-subunit amino acid transport system ATPase component